VRNPFTPTFGVTPPVLAGRDAEIDAIRRALRNGPGDPARAMLLTGARGTGKTVLLNALEDVAGQAGWAVLSVTARPGLVDQLTDTLLPQLLNRHDPKTKTSRITAGSVNVLGVGGGFTRQVEGAHPVRPDLRRELEDLATVMADQAGGVFLSVDEVQRGVADELREIFQAVQHCFRQGLEVICVAAGLPSGVSDLLNDEVLTFLRRAERHALGGLADAAVRSALRQPVVDGGREISSAALDESAAAVDGYPFLGQVVGFHLWEDSPARRKIDVTQARRAIGRALADAGRLVYEPLLADLSARDVDFLTAMARIGQDPVPMADIEAAFAGPNAGQYRRRLIAAEAIEPAGRGKVRFAVPGLATFLRSSMASLGNH